MEKFTIGSVVQALQGRDKGMLYIISKIENNRVYLVNGKNRTTVSPKIKNIKHIQYLSEVPELKWNQAQRINYDIANALKIYGGKRV